MLTKLTVRNFRSIANAELPLGGVNIFFGPNAAGKTSLLDSLSFIRDVIARGPNYALRRRNLGVGIRHDSAEIGDPIYFGVETELVRYEMEFAAESGRIQATPGERLSILRDGRTIFPKGINDKQSNLFDGASVDRGLELPHTRLELTRAALATADSEAATVYVQLRTGNLFSSRDFVFTRMREAAPVLAHSSLHANGRNLFLVLRKLLGRSEVDTRYATITGFMREAFPDTFDGFVFEELGTSVFAFANEIHRREPTPATHWPDGYLQMAVLLAALFEQRGGLLLLDEPDLSLHPWAIAVLAKAIRTAVKDWGRQVLLATHSPVLLSQFEPNEIWEVMPKDGQTKLRRLDTITEVQDLLEHYAVGSLYMSEAVGRQSSPTQDVNFDEP